MFDGTDLYRQIMEALQNDEQCINEMTPYGIAMAEAERKYRVEKQRRILFERDHNKTPVTIIQDVVKGYEDIAALHEKFVIAQVEYETNKVAEMYWKKRADTLREIYRVEGIQGGQQW